MDEFNFFQDYNAKDWEQFCERMLRHKYGQEHFYVVPDDDGGDHGIEFFSSDGSIYQCYFPDVSIAIQLWKQRVQKKINDDLPLLKTNEDKVSEMLDGIIIKQWVLLTPKNMSKDLLKYCNKKKNEFLKNPPKFVDQARFRVRIETAKTYPDSTIYALSCSPKKINLNVFTPEKDYQDTWVSAHTEESDFLGNINRKSERLMGGKADVFKERVIEKYIQMERFLEELRIEYPDQYMLVEDTARGLLINIKDLALFHEADAEFVKQILQDNESAFKKYSENMSDSNLSILSFGYISKWIAECNMDFK